MKIIMFLVLLIGLSGCASTYVDERTRSPHFRDGQFRNGIEAEKSWWSFLKMRLTTDYSDWPEWVDVPHGPKPGDRVTGDAVVVTHINHSTVLIQTGGYNVLTDPIYSERCSPLSFIGPRRVHQPGIRFEDLPKIDAVVISHDHYDHLDLPTVRRLVERDNPKIYLGLGVGERLPSMDNVTELDWWERIEVADGFALTFVPVQHFSSRTPFDRFSTLWGGYVLEIGGGKIYFGGDSGYADHYLQTYERFGPMDLSLIPVGGYAPRDFMGFAHLDPGQAVQAHLDLRSRKSIGIHYGTFQLTQEPIDEPVRLLAKARESAGLEDREFVTLEFGQPLLIPGDPAGTGRQGE
ncbi:MAG: MBL fold metallo-hydrolase [Sedimenticola sp.]